MNSIRDFGARGDGVTLDTAAIQQAIDSGGTVVIPAGRYLTGTLYLHSGTELILEKGAELCASAAPGDYNDDSFDSRNQVFSSEHVSGAHLLVAMDCRHVVLRGEGTINGAGRSFFNLNDINYNSPDRPIYHWTEWRPAQMLYFCGSSDIDITGLRLENPAYWTCFLHDCEDVRIHDLTIRADRMMNNTDGIDIDCCRRVEVWNCDVDCGDDGVAVRGNDSPFCGRNVPCSQVEVHHCRLRGPACGVRIGVGTGTIRDCRFHHLDIRDTGIGIGLCPSYSRGRCVCIENIMVADCTFTGLQPIRLVPSWGYIIPEPVRQPVRNILIERFSGRGSQASLLLGVRNQGLFGGIVLRDVRLTLEEPSRPPASYHWPFAQYAVLNAAELPDLKLDGFQAFSSASLPGYRYEPEYVPVPVPED